jgi:DNA-binding response OmpR family regulator
VTAAEEKRDRVLIVEDSSLVGDALRVLFEEHGYDVSVADSLDSGRSAAAAQAPDVILLDVVLPDGDGLELAREWSGRGRTVVLALTGYADMETRTRCLDAGCKAVLVKPVPAGDLLRWVDESVADKE